MNNTEETIKRGRGRPRKPIEEHAKFHKVFKSKEKENVKEYNKKYYSKRKEMLEFAKDILSKMKEKNI
jgi:hypothetical protein